MSNGKKRCSSLSSANAARGMVLIVVLWALFFLSALALAMTAYVYPQISLARRLKDSATARALAEAGVQRAMAQVSNAIDKGADTLKAFVPGGRFDFKAEGMGGGEFYYELVDESRKININVVSEDLLERFFEVVAGLPGQEAADMAAAIVDWREPGEKARKNGAKEEYYQSLIPPYPCKRGAFEVQEEILLVKGMTPAIYEKIAHEITIYGAGGINMNTADKAVLLSAGLAETLVDKVINYRSGNDGVPATDDDLAFQNAAEFVKVLESYCRLTKNEMEQWTGISGKGLLCASADHYRGKSYGKNNRESLTIDFVFDRQGHITFWREE